MEVILTEKEQKFMAEFLKSNGCGAKTPSQLLNDNFSCQCWEDLREFKDFTNRQIPGLISSLNKKGVIFLDERDGKICKSKNKEKQWNFLPDLWWVSEEYLKSLEQDKEF
jgi:hypothetical protein